MAIVGETIAQAIVHPMWLIEEQASKGRIWVWFNPPIPPTNTLIAEIAAITGWKEVSIIIINKNIGPIFKIVDNSQHIDQGIEIITEGSQK